jgi:hypothetical protein
MATCDDLALRKHALLFKTITHFGKFRPRAGFVLGGYPARI